MIIKTEEIDELIRYNLTKIQFIKEFNETSEIEHFNKFETIDNWYGMGSCKVVNTEFDIPENIKFLIFAPSFVYNSGYNASYHKVRNKEEVNQLLKTQNALFLILQLKDKNSEHYGKYIVRSTNILEQDILTVESKLTDLKTLLDKNI